jgi:uncharacterized protein (TIGR02001 family)
MRQIALGIVVTGLISTSAWAQEPVTARLATDGALAGLSLTASPQAPAAEPEEKPYTIAVGIDVPTDYYWRGIVQETEGFIAQPFVDLGVTLSDTVSFNVGTWTSLHSSDSTGTFYEADYYASLNFVAGKFVPKVIYTAYDSPNDTFSTVHELAFSVAYDDSDNAFALAPSALLAFDMSNDGNTYLQLGVAPAIPVGGPVSLSVPFALGLSLNDFYSDTYGYTKIGIAGSVQVAPGFSARAGFDLLFLGESVQFDDESVKPVFSAGVTYTY